MGSAGNSLIKGIGIHQIIYTLDSFHPQSWVLAHFSLALKDRLKGQTAFLLPNELVEKDQESTKHAKKLAERIAELGELKQAIPDRVCNVVSIEALFSAK
jgi:ferritin-like protein